MFKQEELHINQKFDEVQVEIELLDTDEPERNYLQLNFKIQEITNGVKQYETSGNNVSLNTTFSSRARLASIELSKFNGNIPE